MENNRCPYCKGVPVKAGFQGKKQRYKCKKCRKRYLHSYSYNAYNKDINKRLIRLLKESCGVKSISRILKISSSTVLSRMLELADQTKTPDYKSKNMIYEIDEIWTYISKKSNVVWITYILERKTKNVIGFYVGRKTKESIKPLIDKLLLLQPDRVYTDRLNIYPSLIPNKIHRRFRYCTNNIERKNLTLRTHIKRLSRRTICFSKDKKYLEAHLKIYFWG